MNSKLHAVCDGDGKPVMMVLSEGQLSDHIGAKLLYPQMPAAKHLIGDKGYDSDEFRAALKAKKIKACIPPRSNRKVQHHYSKNMYKQRHKVECMFGKLKDWRRVSTRYDRCAHTFFSAICIAAIVIFYLK
jgi:putative transposase